jgi:CheY-like chemotaxis protein
LEPAPLEANRLVAGMSDLLRRSLGETINLETVLAGGLWRIHADPNQLESAIVNLAVNSRDAMPNGGKLTIETANAYLDDEYSAHEGLPMGQYVLIAVTDTGAGMTPEVASKVFDPFFTTKKPGSGTGLGLSQVYGFAKQAGGHVGILSAPGMGTTIELLLPPSPDRPVDLHAAEPAPAAEAAAHSEVVLVVEDEPSVCEMAVECLNELGYATLTATNGRAALAVIESGRALDVLFSDIIMPGGIDGVRLAMEARRLRPGIRVILTSGFTVPGHGRDLPRDVPVLAKPYDRAQLASRLRAGRQPHAVEGGASL